jgi:hypothetical protein
VDLSGYLTSSDAANTYLSQSDAASTYLNQSDASSTYLTQSDASSTYLSQSSASSTYATQTALGNTNAKVGSGTLDIGSDLTDGVNQLNSKLAINYQQNSSAVDNVYLYKGIRKGKVAFLYFVISIKSVTANTTLFTITNELFDNDGCAQILNNNGQNVGVVAFSANSNIIQTVSSVSAGTVRFYITALLK